MSYYVNNAKYNFLAIDREFLAIGMALKHWRHYLISKPFAYRTDHASLKWLQT